MLGSSLLYFTTDDTDIHFDPSMSVRSDGFTKGNTKTRASPRIVVYVSGVEAVELVVK